MAPQEGFKDTNTQYIRNKQYFATIRINEDTQKPTLKLKIYVIAI